MAQYPASIDVGSLDGSNGFRLTGGAIGASAGDINGDGFADLIVGSPSAGGTGAGYVVFGKAGGFAANTDLTTLDGTNGFKISGVASGDSAGFSVASAGDVNGDGLADMIIGAPNADPHAPNTGASYVVFGRSSGFGANFNLSSLDGSNGFTLNGQPNEWIGNNPNTNDAQNGFSVASAGDVNGDGFADVIIGEPGYGNGETDLYDNPRFRNYGASFVVFGKPPALLPRSNFPPSTGRMASGFAAAFTATSTVT